MRSADKSLKIAKELSDLVLYCQPVAFDWDTSMLSFTGVIGLFILFSF